MTGTPHATEPYGLAGGRINAEEIVMAPTVTSPPAPLPRGGGDGNGCEVELET